jgi:hypothetical protein
VLVDFCERVAELHRCHLAHGSIKVQNVIIVATPSGCRPALLDTGIRPTIEGSWISRRAVREPDPAAVFGDDRRRVDMDDLRRLVSNLLERRADIASFCGNIWSDSGGSNWRTAEDVASHLKATLGHMQGV